MGTLGFKGGHLGDTCGAYLRHDGSKSASVAPKVTTSCGNRRSRLVDGKVWRQVLARRRGGRLRLRALQRFFSSLHYYLARPATSERGAADIYIYIYIYMPAASPPPCAPWAPQGPFSGLFGFPWAPLGTCWGPLGTSWDPPGPLLGPPWPPLGSFWVLLDTFWVPLGTSWAPLGPHCSPG